MKLDVSRQRTEQKNGISNHCIYTIRGLNVVADVIVFVLWLLRLMIMRGESTTKYLTPN